MSCRRIERLIESYVDGEASGGERETVERHVSGCAACAVVVEESRRLRALLAGAPQREVSAAFERNLAAALQEVPSASGSAAWWERFRLRFEWRLRVPALVTAGSVAASALAVSLILPQVQQSQVSQARERYVASAVERHRQLEESADAAGPVNWDAVDASIEANTGSVVD